MKTKALLLICILAVYTVKVSGACTATITGGTTPICSGTSPGTFEATGSGGTVTAYLWYLNSISTGITTTTYNPGNLTSTSDIYCVITCDGSGVPSNTITITVNSLPTATTSSNSPRCEGSTLNLTGGPDGMTTYSWTGPAGFSSPSQNPTIAGITLAKAGDYHLTVIDGNGCTSAISTASVVVNALPVAGAITGGNAVCMGSTLALASHATGTGTLTYVWSSSDEGVATVSVTGVVTPVSVGTTNITYEVTDGSSTSCKATSAANAVTVNALPVAGAITGGNAVCMGSTLALASHATGTGTLTYVWSSSDEGVATVSVTGVVTPVSVGTTNVTYEVTDGSSTSCKATSAANAVTVNALPVAGAITGGNAVCMGSTLALASHATGTGTLTYVWSSSDEGVATVSVTGVVTPVSVGTTNITYEVTDGSSTSCKATSAANAVTVNALPVAGAITGGNAVCMGSTLALASHATGTGTLTYVWSSSDEGVATVSVTGVVTPVSVGTTNVTYEVTDGSSTSCKATSAANAVTVNALPVAGAITGGNAVCMGSTLALASHATGTGTLTYVWSSSDEGVATVSVTGVVTPVSVGTTNITYEVTDGSSTSCKATSAANAVTVKALPVFTSTLAPPDICSGTTFTYIAIGTPVGVTFDWTRATVTGITQPGTSGPGNVSETLTNETADPIDVTYIYIATYDGCSSAPKNVVVKVNPKPAINEMTATCKSQTAFEVTPANATNGIVPGSTKYVWDAPSYDPSEISGGAAGSVPALSITGNLKDKKNYSVIATYYVIYPTAGSCTGSPFKLTMTVNPGAVISDKTATICNSGTFTVTPLDDPLTPGGDIVPVGTNYTWPTPVAPGISSGLAEETDGAGNISGTLTNSTSAPVNVVYTVTPQSGTVTGETFAVTVTVNPEAQVNQPGNQEVCNGGSTADVNFSSINTGTTTYAWTNTTTSIGLAASGDGNIPAFTAINNGTDPVTATITVTPTFTNGVACTGPTKSFTIKVNPTAVVTSAASVFLCNNVSNTYNIESSSTTPAPSYVWNRGSVTGITPATGTGNSNSITETLSNSTTAPVMVHYMIVPTVNGCAGTTKDVSVTVNPEAQVNQPGNQEVCNGGSTADVNFSSINTGTTTYAWTNTTTSIGLAASGNGNIPAFTAINNGTDPVTATITVTPTFTNGVACTGPTKSFTIKVNPTAVVTSAASVFLCNNVSNTYNIESSSTTPAPSYVWNRGSVTGITPATGTGNSNSITETLSNSTTAPVMVHYMIVPTVNGCAGTTKDVSVTVNPEAQVNQPGNQEVCNGGSTADVNFSSINTGTTTYAWTNTTTSIGLAASGDGNIPAFTAINNGTDPVTATITVTPTFTNGVACTGPTKSFTIKVNPTAVVTSAASVFLCNNVSNTYNIESSSTTPAPSYVWNRGSVTGITPATGTGNSNSITETLSNSTTAPVMVHYMIVPTVNGCAGTTKDVSVTVNPEAQVNQPGNQEVCNGGSTADVNFSSINTGTTTYAWTNTMTSIGLAASGDGNIPAFTAINNGTDPVTATITVTPTFTNGVACTGPTKSFTITVNPTAQVNQPGNQEVCNGGSTADVNFSSINTGTTTYAWTNTTTSIGLAASGDGNIPAFTAINNGTDPVTATITVTPTFTNGVACTGPTKSFTIKVNPTAVVTSAVSVFLCNNVSNTYNIESSSTTPAPSYVWNRGSVTGITPATGTGNSNSITETLSNSTTAPVMVHYMIVPTVNGCAGTTKDVSVTVNPEAQVNQPGNQEVCNGGSTADVNFSSINTGTTTYAWTNTTTSIGLAASGDGNIPAFTAINNGTDPVTATITVTPTFTNGVACTGPTKSFTIKVNPTAVVTSAASVFLCNNVSNTYNIESSSTTPAPSYVWNRGSVTGITPATGTGNSNSITETLSNSTTAPVMVHYMIVPTVNGCAGTTKDVSVTVNPEAQVNQPGNQEVCNGGSTADVNFSSINTGTTTYAWTNTTTSIGLAASGNGNIPAFTAINNGTDPVTATITVTPTFTNGVACTGPTKTFTITVNPTAQVNQPGNQILCNSTSTTTIIFGTINTGGTTTYSWINNEASIGLGTSGTGNIPAFTAINNGTSPVTATVIVTPHFLNSTNCDGPSKTFTITVNPTGQVNDPADQVVCNEESTTAVSLGTINTGGTTTYSWENNTVSIGLPASGFGNIEAFTATNSGTVPVVATITITPHYLNSINCDGPAQTFTITVNPTGQVNDPADQTVCNGSPTYVSFSTNNTGGNTTYSWTNNKTSIGLAASGNDDIASFKAINTGTSPVTATITVTPHYLNSLYCDGPAKTFTITVNPTGQVNDPADQVVCNGLSTTAVNFSTVNTGGITTYSWENNTASIGLPASGVGDIGAFTATNSGTIPVVATITITPHFTNGVTCNGTQTFTITVDPSPIANDQTPPTLCEDVYGGGTTAGINLLLLEDAITNGAPDRLVTWYSNAARTTLVSTPSNMTISDGMIFYPRVTNTITNCINDAVVTYRVSTKRPPQDVEIKGVAKLGATLTVVYNSHESCMPEVVEESEITWYRSGTGTDSGIRIITTSGTDNTYVLSANDLDKYIRVAVKLSDGSGVLYNAVYNTLHNGTSAEWIGPVTDNDAPTASGAVISGTLEATQTLTADYTYSDTEGDPQGVSVFKWFTKTSLSEPYAVISGETGITHVIGLDEQGNYFKFSVTPKAGLGTAVGITDTTDVDYGPVDMQPYAVTSDITGDMEVGKPLTGHYTYFDVDGDAEGVTTFRWLRNGVPISGATSITYLLTADDETNKITFEVTPVSLTGYPKTGTPVTSSPTVAIAPIVVDFVGFRNVYCYDGGIDTISIKNVPAGASDLKFRMTNTNGFVEQLDNTTIVVDPQKMTPVRTTGNVVDSLVFSYYERGTTFNISRPFVIDSIAQDLDLLNIDPAYCEDVALKIVTVDKIFPLGGTGSWEGDITLLTDRTTNGAKINPLLGTAGSTYDFTYQYTSPKGCLSEVISRSVKINALPDPDFALNPIYNVDGGKVTLVPVLEGGLFSGVGVLGDKLDPYEAGTGSFIVTYKITDQNNCTNTLSKTTTIKKAQGEFTGITATMCYIDSTYKVKVTDLPPGMTVNYFTNKKNSIVHVAGTTEADYSVLAAGGGYDSIKFSYNLDGVDYWISTGVFVEYLEPAIINLEEGQKFCSTGPQFKLKDEGNHTGGVFSGTTVNLGYLDPSITLGATSVTYVYTNQATGCSSIPTTVSIYIIESPKVSFVASDNCIESVGIDSTHFINTTVSEDPVVKWTWSFSEVNATPVYKEAAAYLYKTGGPHTLSLNAETLNGCTFTQSSTINVGVKPTANFYWKNDCYSPGRTIRLFHTSESDIISRTWNFNEGSVISHDDMPEFTMPNTGYVKVEYTIGTDYCTDKVTRNIYLRPTYSLASDGPYEQSFESGEAGWLKEDSLSATSSQNTWTFGTPDRYHINKAASGVNAWYLGYDTVKQELKDNYSVISPCFDFTGIQKPMISLKIFKRFDRNRNGAALQYKTEESSEWTHVGTVDDGINWYNSAVINGSPGGDKVGWTSIDDPDTAWTESRHKLDIIEGMKNVKFRIVYGGDGSSVLNEGMAFDDIWIGERTRHVLLEHFTNITSKTASTATTTVNDIATNNSEDLVNIQYHTNFPGSDPYYDQNPEDVSARILSYGLTRVPYSMIDGGNNADEYALSVNYEDVQLDSNDISRRSLLNPKFLISLDPSVAGGVLTVNCKLTAINDITSDNLVLYLAVTEKENNECTGANGENTFYNVFRKFIPDAGGILLKQSWAPGEQLDVPEQSWVITKVKNLSDIEIIGLVQNSLTKELYQVSSEVLTKISVGVENPSQKNSTGFGIYPNPADKMLTVSFTNPLSRDAEIRIYDFQGAVISTYKAAYGISEFVIEDIGLKAGIYLVRVSAGGIDMGFRKLIITGN